MTHAVGRPDAFEQGVQAFLSVWQTTRLPPICPYDPAKELSLYEEWFAGYEYTGHLSTIPETKLDRAFGPFKQLLR